MSQRVDSLNFVSNTKSLPLEIKFTNNNKIEMFATDSIKANVDEVNISEQNTNNQAGEKSDNKKKWLICAGIALGTIAVGTIGLLLFKNTKSSCEIIKKTDDMVNLVSSNKNLALKETAKNFTSEWGRKFTSNEIENITTKYNIDTKDLVDIIACKRPMEEGNNMKIFEEFFNIMNSKSPTLTHRIQKLKKNISNLPRNITKIFKNCWTMFKLKLGKYKNKTQ